MQPSLQRILDVTLDQLNISEDLWESIKDYRVAKSVKVKQIVATLAHKNGYTHQQISEFLHHNRSTITHHILLYKDLCEVYSDVREELNTIEEALSGNVRMERYTSYAWLARTMSGILTISPSKPEEIEGFWMAVDTKVFYPQSSFPQVTYETGPTRVKINITIDKQK